MKTTNQPAAAEARDRAAGLLRRLTVWSAAGALAATGILALVAGVTIPGKSDASAQTGSSGSTSSSSSSSDDDTSSGASSTSSSSSSDDDTSSGTSSDRSSDSQGLQGASQAPSAGFGRAHAVSGGS
jgi:cytoskeletal protein RodZ